MKALARRGVKLNPERRSGRGGAIVIAVKPQSAPEAVPPLARLRRQEHAGGLDHGRPHDRLSGKRAAARHRDRARHAEHAGRDRPRHHASRSPMRKSSARQRKLADRPARRHRRGRMGRRRSADGRGDRGVRLRPGLCFPAGRSDGQGRHRRRAAGRACRASWRARPSPAPANCCIARTSTPRRCGRTSPRPAAPPPRRSRC